MTQATEIPVGTVVVFSTGEYSDYGYCGMVRVLKPLHADLWENMRTAANVLPDYAQGDEQYRRFDEGAAIAWLVAQGYVEEMEYTELHMGDYDACPRWSDA